jgi:hypothetical protein
LETFAIPESQGDAVTEGVEKVVLTIAPSITNTKAFDLIEQVVSRALLVDDGLVGLLRVPPRRRT